MLLKTKILMAVLALLLVGGGAFVCFSIFADNNTAEPEAEKVGWYFPYTGIETENELAASMRPLCVKIPNDKKARPQSGINSADVVYETMVEGGETRLNAIFQSKVPDEVGPIRSARLSDIWIVPQYDGMLFFSGANSQVRKKLSSHKVNDMRWDYSEDLYYRAKNGRDGTHNLFLKLGKSYDAARKLGYETSSSALRPLHFMGAKYNDVKSEDETEKKKSDSESKTSSAAIEATSGSSVEVKIAKISDIEFKWDKESGKYLKWMNGEEHKDDQDDKQVNVDNVIILWAKYTQQKKVDAAGSPTYDTKLGGSGKAAIFVNGKRYDCTWKADKTTPPRFYDENEKELLLKPGKTWIVVPPDDTKITSK